MWTQAGGVQTPGKDRRADDRNQVQCPLSLEAPGAKVRAG